MLKSSIVILTKNDAANVELCLEAVFGQKGAGQFEVIVVDSGSTDGTLEIAARVLAARAEGGCLVRLERIPAGTFHHARTRNYAASLATGEILVVLSQDAIPSSGEWLRALISSFSDPRVGAVYGKQLPKPGSTGERQDVLGTLYGEQRIVKDPCCSTRDYCFYHFSDANAAIRRSVWQATRFPEELKVFEDLGIAKRMLDRGWKIVYEPRAGVYHSHNHTTLGLFRRYFDIGYTFRQLGIWSEATRSSLCKDAWQLVRNKVARFGRSANGRTARASLRQDLAKSAGMFLGLNERFLPLALKRQMSAFRVYE